MAKKEETGLEVDEIIEESHDSVEHFIENNQNIIIGVLGFIVLAVAIFVGYNKLIVAPKEAEAKNIVYHAQNWFAADSFQLALDGDGANPGFYDIIDEFGVTKVGKTAKYYAGICELNLGNYEDAIDYLSKFKASDPNIQAVAYGAIGDANAELDDIETAAKQYKKAASVATLKSISSSYLYRAGKAYELLEDFGAAKNAYEEIVSNYPDANQLGLSQADQTIAKNAHKSLAQVEAQLN